ncbi:MAG: hypothetical protein VX113_08005 [Pseudomonadota bacterium]|nr:hypothetical protein [Pseudomonadota bacterium]
MGQNMMRCDGDSHQRQRRQMQPAVSPRTVSRHWQVAFRTAAASILRDLAPRGEADLCTEYAMPLSGEALRLITGLDNVSAKQMDAHSQAMIDGISNYAGDADTEARCLAAVAALDLAIGDRLADFASSPPDPESAAGVSVIAVLQRAAATAQAGPCAAGWRRPARRGGARRCAVADHADGKARRDRAFQGDLLQDLRRRAVRPEWQL